MTTKSAYFHSKTPKHWLPMVGNKFRLFFALIFIFGLAFSLPATAKLYKWVDDKGVTHYGEVIPPEYADKSRVELNKQGQVVKEQQVLTPEERNAKKETDAKQQLDKEATRKQERYDKTLTSTYSSSKEIGLARNRNLLHVDGRINSINSQIKMASDNVLGLKNEADGYTKAKKKIPVSLQEDLQDSEARLAKLQLELEKTKAERSDVESRYDADKSRYKELTGK